MTVVITTAALDMVLTSIHSRVTYCYWPVGDYTFFTLISHTFCSIHTSRFSIFDTFQQGHLYIISVLFLLHVYMYAFTHTHMYIYVCVCCYFLMYALCIYAFVCDIITELNQEKTEELLKQDIYEFNKSELKHHEVHEKNILPDEKSKFCHGFLFVCFLWMTSVKSFIRIKNYCFIDFFHLCVDFFTITCFLLFMSLIYNIFFITLFAVCMYNKILYCTFICHVIKYMLSNTIPY